MSTRHLSTPLVAALATGLALTLSGCGGTSSSGSSTSGGTSSSSTGSSAPTELHVLAAASLKKSFTSLAQTYEQAHPGTKVALTFAGSSDLVTQVADGAPADVLATADEKNMAKVDKSHLAGTPQIFATNVLTIVTAPGNPEHITGLKSLQDKGIDVVVCAKQVPCGSATDKLEQASGVTLHPVSEENAVTDVLGKVTSGQADAGLVYVTDAKSAGDKVATVDVPEAKKIVNRYPIAVLTGDARTASQEFVDLVTGAEGQKVLQGNGFGAP